MKILALDFDGVIADSKLECLMVAFNTYLKLKKSSKLFNNTKMTFNNFNDLIESNKEIFDKYHSLRVYVSDGFCFFVICHILESKITIKSQDSFNKIRNSLMNYYEQYIKLFYKERDITQRNFDEWLKLIKPYPVIKNIKKLKENFIITVSTNNREKNILPFLKKYLVPVKKIADSLISTNKAQQLEYLKTYYKSDFNELFFVDDQALHFEKLLKLKVKCFLAGWGYNNEEQRNYAESIGVEILNQDNFYRRLIKYQ